MATYPFFLTAVRVTTEARHVGPTFDETWPSCGDPEPPGEYSDFWEDFRHTRELPP